MIFVIDGEKGAFWAKKLWITYLWISHKSQATDESTAKDTM